MITDNSAVGTQDGYEAWKQDVNQYTQSKKEFQGVPEPYKKVTSAFQKGQDVSYNPNTQTYSDKQREQQVRDLEQRNMLEVLAKNKVSDPSIVISNPIRLNLVGQCIEIPANIQHFEI